MQQTLLPAVTVAVVEAEAAIVAAVTKDVAVEVADALAVVDAAAPIKLLIIPQQDGKSCHTRNATRSERNAIRRASKEAPNEASLNSPQNN